MSGLNEIIQWVEDSDIEIDLSKNSEENFQVINKRFDDDNRSDLSDILGDEKGKFLEYLELQQPTQPEIEARSLLDQVSRFFRGLFK